MQSEKWLPVPGWESVYEVSSLGRLRRIEATDCGPALRILNGTVLADTGYQVVRLRHRGRVARPYVHRLVMAAFRGPCPEGAEVNHIDGQRANNALHNLEYVTSSGNKIHAYRTLFRPKVSNKGENAGRAKLRDADVLNIRARYAAGGVTQQSLADEYGVNQTLIGFIVRRKVWTHL